MAYISLLLLGCWWIFGLAVGAEVGATISDENSLNGGATDGAEDTTKAVGNLKLKMCRARCAIGTEVGIHSGYFITNS